MSTTRRTTCNRDCPDGCGIVATIANGQVFRLGGDRSHPVTRGRLCPRTAAFLRRQHANGRLTTPLVRRRGQLVPTSWDAALDHVAEGLERIRQRHGPGAILHYLGGGSLGILLEQASTLFFELLGPVTVKRGDVCSGAGEAAQLADFGVCDSSDLPLLERARHVLLWGKNVATSSPHTLDVLQRARARGAELVLVDPVHHRTARHCERHVQVRPGGDLALGLGVIRLLFDRDLVDPEAASFCDGLAGLERLARGRSVGSWCAEADVPVGDAEDLARRLSERPTAILVGWGLGRRRHGGATVRVLDALGAISGNLGIPGGGVSYYFQRRRAFRALAAGRVARTVSEPLLGAEIVAAADPPIEAVWVTASNPVAMLPDSAAVAAALSTRALTVVVDSWLSDTAALASVVLPTTTLLEADDLLGAYGHHYIGEARPLVPPPPGVRSDLEIFQALAERLGLAGFPRSDARSLKALLLDPDLAAHGIDLDRLAAGPVRNPLAPRVLFAERRFATASGKVQLLNELPAPPAQSDRAYPLWLMALSTPASQASQWVGAPPRPLVVTVHPDSAAGIADGGPGRLESVLGGLAVRVRHDARQRGDVALVPKGGHYRDGAAANAITRAALTDLGEGAALYDERVRLVAAAGSGS